MESKLQRQWYVYTVTDRGITDMRQFSTARAAIDYAQRPLPRLPVPCDLESLID